MNRFLFAVLVMAGYILLQGCAVQNHANTIVQDPDNPCIIRIVVQVGIVGTDADVEAVDKQLQECFKTECFLPCGNDTANGCKVTLNAIVKKWDSLSADEQEKFHRVQMVDNDGLPSWAGIGEPNGKRSVGEWRRNEPAPAYCHETMHFLGLADKYCARIFDAVDSTTRVERTCDPPPDPLMGNCCVPGPTHTRCGLTCPGHDDDLMATLAAKLSCKNILEVASKAGFDKCPESCCSSGNTFHEFFVGPGYFHFSEDKLGFGAYGGTIGYTYKLKASIGLTLDGGYYSNTDKQEEVKQKNNIFTLGAGITYQPKFFDKLSKFDLSTHALLGVTQYKIETEYVGSPSQEQKDLAFSANLGVSLDYGLSKKFGVRVFQLDYIPTFFPNGPQHNYRFSIGITMSSGN